MRVVFMGTPEFAVPILDALTRLHEVAAVYTRADSVSRRGSRLVASPVKQRALQLGLDVRQPESLKGEGESHALSALRPDVLAVAAYGLILPPTVLDIAPYGAVNVHASLLPRWRGAAPVQRAILAGDTVTGVSIMRMEEGLDTGPYALQVPVEIADHDAPALTSMLADAGAAALVRVLDMMASGGVVWVEQSEADATYAAKITKDDVRPDPALPADEIVRRVRASGPTAPARIAIGPRTLTLVACEPSPVARPNGSVSCSSEGLLLGAADGAVLATIVRPDGKRDMPGDACARGMNLDESSRWAGA